MCSASRIFKFISFAKIEKFQPLLLLLPFFWCHFSPALFLLSFWESHDMNGKSFVAAPQVFVVFFPPEYFLSVVGTGWFLWLFSRSLTLPCIPTILLLSASTQLFMVQLKYLHFVLFIFIHKDFLFLC